MIWIIIIGIIAFAFLARAVVKLTRRRFKGYHSDISTKKKRLRFVNRFRHLEGIGD